MVSYFTELEVLQMRHIYIALYSSLGLANIPDTKPLTAATVARKLKGSGNDYIYPDISLDAGDNDGLTEIEKTRLIGPAKASLEKRFPEIRIMIHTFRKHLGSIDASTALHKWRWLCRDSSDKLVVRYIRNHGSSIKVMRAIAQTIVWEADEGHGEREFKRGEKYYMDIEPDEKYISYLKRGVTGLVGHDKWGRPTLVIRDRYHTASLQSKEAARRSSNYYAQLLLVAQSDLITGGTTVFDLTGISPKNIDMGLVRYLARVTKFAFPSLLGCIIIHNAPSFFAVMFKVIKPLLDPFLAEKIFFTKTTDDLLNFFDADQLPKHLGGKSSFEGKWIPPSDEDDAPMKDFRTKSLLTKERDTLIRQFEELTIAWLGGKSNEDQRRLVAKSLREVYWTLDPYVRSRHLFDRQGISGTVREQFAPGGISQPICGTETYNPVAVDFEQIPFTPSLNSASSSFFYDMEGSPPKSPSSFDTHADIRNSTISTDILGLRIKDKNRHSLTAL